MLILHRNVNFKYNRIYNKQTKRFIKHLRDLNVNIT